MERHGYTVEELRARRSTPAFREVMRKQSRKPRAVFGRVAVSTMVDRRWRSI